MAALVINLGAISVSDTDEDGGEISKKKSKKGEARVNRKNVVVRYRLDEVIWMSQGPEFKKTGPDVTVDLMELSRKRAAEQEEKDEDELLAGVDLTNLPKPPVDPKKLKFESASGPTE